VSRRGGWRRHGRKRFTYVDSRGRPIDDEEQLERIRALAIPPGWREVWISPNAGAKIQATGIDRAGRKQYRYHDAYRAAQDRAKFERLVDFGRRLPRLRAQTARHLRVGPYGEEWACAIAVGVINKTWFRVGSDRHARHGRTYGVTTLTKRHASVDDDQIVFCFRAKNRKLVRRTIRSAPLARGIDELLDLPDGSRLFRFLRDGELTALTSRRLNEYLAEHLGNGFTAKDFRTWGGTLLAAVEFERLGPPEDESDAKRTIASVMRKVGTELGNTPAVARDAYVSPVLLRSFVAGRTLAEFRNGSRRSRLTADETALLALLRAGA
jgi:DNA topoisomerase-1